jgi:diadenosine tetraphosphate (Ap4A) HIT family hydrolase
MPTAHPETIDDLDEVTAGPTPRTASTCGNRNGVAAGQEVKPAHIHVLPRLAGDGLMRICPGAPLERYNADSKVLARVAQRVTQALV